MDARRRSQFPLKILAKCKKKRKWQWTSGNGQVSAESEHGNEIKKYNYPLYNILLAHSTRSCSQKKMSIRDEICFTFSSRLACCSHINSLLIYCTYNKIWNRTACLKVLPIHNNICKSKNNEWGCLQGPSRDHLQDANTRWIQDVWWPARGHARGL